MSLQKTQRDPFFLYYHSLLLLIVVGGFGINGMINTTELPPISNLVIAHGAIMLLWFVIVPVQALLIRQGSYKLHIALGTSSTLLAVGIILSGLMISLDNYQRTTGPAVMTFNLPILINFTILFGLAIYRRKHADQHKRLILFSSIAMMAPALGRITRVFDINEFLSVPMWLILIVIVIFYDRRKLNRVHKSSWLGAGLIILGIVIAIILIDNPGWHQLLQSLLA